MLGSTTVCYLKVTHSKALKGPSCRHNCSSPGMGIMNDDISQVNDNRSLSSCRSNQLECDLLFLVEALLCKPCRFKILSLATGVLWVVNGYAKTDHLGTWDRNCQRSSHCFLSVAVPSSDLSRIRTKLSVAPSYSLLVIGT